jgi:hypothetical protein
MSLMILGGSGNIIHNLIDIGDPQSTSFRSNDPALQVWTSFFEDDVTIESGTFEFAVTKQGMTTQRDTWTEPVQVSDEVILRKDGVDRVDQATSDLPVPPAFEMQPWMSGTAKRRAAVAAVGAERRYRTQEGFGARFLAAGADPTGSRLSDAAFEKVMTEEGVVCLPAGVFRVSKPILARQAAKGLGKSGGATGPTAILGAGPGKTIIKAADDVPAVLDFLAGMSKRTCGTSTSAADDVVAVEGVSIEGGQVGIALPLDGLTSVVSDFSIKGSGKAAVAFGPYDAWFEMPAQEGVACPDGSESKWCNDAHLFEGGEVDGYDYGVIYPGFADKMGFKNVTFRNQNVAGISATKTNLFHGWIGGCTFSDINGPGVDLSGGLYSEHYGYMTQWVTMIEGCTFTNCGSDTRAALDYGLTDINMFCNSEITGTKPVKYGFLGSLAQMSNVTIDVNATKAAMALRHPRMNKASRTPATTMVMS